MLSLHYISLLASPACVACSSPCCSVGCSLEEGLLKHHLSISRQLQPQLDEASPASPEAAGSKQQLSGRNVLSSTSLAPVKEEHP